MTRTQHRRPLVYVQLKRQYVQSQGIQNIKIQKIAMYVSWGSYSYNTRLFYTIENRRRVFMV